MTKKVITTGFQSIDNIIGGIRSDDLVVIAGKSGIGTTSFALNIVTNNFASNNICYLTLRDTEETIAERLYVLKESMGIKMSIVSFSIRDVSVTSEDTECDGSSIIHLPSPKLLELQRCISFRKYDTYIIDSVDWTGSKKKTIKTLAYLKLMAEALSRPIIALASADKYIEPKSILTGRDVNDRCVADLLLQIDRPCWTPMKFDDDDETELDNFDEYYSACEEKETLVIISRPNKPRNQHVGLTFFPKTGQFKEPTKP